MLLAGGAATGLSAAGRIVSGQQQKQAYDYNADVTLLNAANEDQANQQKTTARIGAQATAYAASGVDLTSGSPLLIMRATAARGAQQGEQIEEAGTEEANLQRYYGKIAAFSGTMSGIGAFLNGMTSDLTSYAKVTNNPTPTAPADPGIFGPQIG